MKHIFKLSFPRGPLDSCQYKDGCRLADLIFASGRGIRHVRFADRSPMPLGMQQKGQDFSRLF
jgi:hypothetical protein